MQPTSPRLLNKKGKISTNSKNTYQLSFRKKNNPQSKSKLPKHNDHPSQPQTPRYLNARPQQREEEDHFIRTVSLTNTLIKAVENQKQILKNIKTISAQILKNKKEKKKQEESMDSSPDVNKFYFPMKITTNPIQNNPHALYGIQESLSSDQSEGNSNFDEYCLLNTTKPKIGKIQSETQQYLKPKIIIAEKKIKENFKKKPKKSQKNNSLKGSRDKSGKLHKSGSSRKYKGSTPSSPRYLYPVASTSDISKLTKKLQNKRK